MSFSETLRSRKPQLDESVEVAFNGPSNNTIELTEFGKLTEEGAPADLVLETEPVEGSADKEDLISEELTDQETGDQKSLIASEKNGIGSDATDGIDSDGVVREYEVALKHLGFGLFHILLLFINGTALVSDAIEVLSISFVLPLLSSPEEFGVGDVSEGILSSIIFLGMLFGSYIWGGLADVIGRRTTIVCSLTISAVFGFLSAFSPWFWLFALLRFFSGFGVGGSLPVIFPYTSEFIRNKYRGPYLGVQSTFWMFGRFLCGGFAWAIIPQGNIDTPLGEFRFHSWRLFIAISALPSFIGAILYFFLPESPRYLLEVGKQEKAMKGLRLAYKLNHLGKSGEYPVKNIFIEKAKSGLFLRGRDNKMRVFVDRCKEVFYRSLELFKREYIRQTSFMLVVMFCLSFGSYGVTLWFPTYVDQVNTQIDMENFEKFCNGSVTLKSDDSIESYCGCENTIFSNFMLRDMQVHNFKADNAIFNNVDFINVSFVSVQFNGAGFSGCHFSESNFSNTYFNATNFDDVTFNSVSLQSCSLCSMTGSDVEVEGEGLILQNVDVDREKIKYDTFNTSQFNQLLNLNESDCAVDDRYEKMVCRPSESRLYRDTFIITASAFPGNVASAFAVYFLRRNYWLAFSLFASTLSAFLLYAANTELFVVVMLCIFNAVSVPAWNDSSLLIAELYPTYLRSTAAGVHLIMARIGAIFGTNIFGAFVRVNPTIPIILVAAILFVGALAALGLPKTTRKTLLK